MNKSGNKFQDSFDQLAIDLFNVGSGNLLQPDNPLSWNIWMTPPILVDQTEWQEHAEFWRTSIDVNHGKSPTAQRSCRKNFKEVKLGYSGDLSEMETQTHLIEAFFERHITSGCLSCLGC